MATVIWFELRRDRDWNTRIPGMMKVPMMMIPGLDAAAESKSTRRKMCRLGTKRKMTRCLAAAPELWPREFAQVGRDPPALRK